LILTEEIFIETTYEAILEAISKPALEGANILLNERVMKITTPSGDSSKKISVTTEKGEVLEYDGLIVTTPLGWLKRNKEAFYPPLPERICRGIENISVGILEKVRLNFQSNSSHS
jgi:monoamine oxidase